MDITETFEPNSQEHFRTWLAEHHDKKNEIWVISYKKDTGKQKVTYDELIDEALCFGWIDATQKKLDEERFALRFSPRRPKSNWTETNIAKYHKHLSDGRMTEAGTKAFNNRKIN